MHQKSKKSLSRSFIRHYFGCSDNSAEQNMQNSIKKLQDFLTKQAKIYHGCMKRNKNATRKVINFKRGKLCVWPSSNLSWKKDIKEKDMTTEPKRMFRQYAEKIALQYGLNAIHLKK